MKVLTSIYKVVSLLLFIPIFIYGQSTLRGTVSDSTSRETVIGANVILIGTSLGCATDIEGAYRIIGIPERTFEVRVSYIGYETKVIEIDFSKNKEAQLDIRLKPSMIMGEEVVVTAQMRGQMAAINQQITSKTIVNVVSEEKIQELPDANAAEAIGRLPGVSIIRSGGEANKVVLRGLSSKFSNITVDGVKVPATDSTTRDVDLSMLSQGSLAGIELYKTLTPDQDADAIAGTINLVTRKAPSERLIRLDLKGDYNYLMKSAKQYDVSARYGERFFDEILGIQLQGNAERKIRSREDITLGYVTFDNPQLDSYINHTYDISLYDNDYNINRLTVDFTDEIRKRTGGQVILDINTPDSGSVKLTGLYQRTDRNYMRYNRVYPAGASAYYDYNFRYTEQGISTTSGSLQGKNYFLGLAVDWNFAYAHSRTTNPYDYSMKFTETPPASSGYEPAKDHPEIHITPFTYNNYLSAPCSSSVFFKQENFDRERTATTSISKIFNIGQFFTNEIKIGGKYKEKLRWMNRQELDANNYLASFSQYSTNEDGSPIILTGTRFENYLTSGRVNLTAPSLGDFVDQPVVTRNLMGLYRMDPIIDKSTMQLWYELNKNAVFGSSREYVNSAAADLDHYSVTERVSSAYIMNTLDIGQMATMIVGVRIEKELNDYTSRFAPGGLSQVGTIVTAPKIIDTTASYTETIWLPNAQLALRPTDFLSIRFAAYRALARPDFDWRLSKFGIVSASGAVPSIEIGNPYLKDAKAWNFEVNTQVYNNTIGLFSISVFYKVIDDLFHQTNAVNINWLNTVNEGKYPSKYYVLDSLMNAIGTKWMQDSSFVNLIHPGGNSYNVSIAYNSNSPSYAWGFELEHQMNFGFIPVSWLQNITLSYNISITRSKTNIILSEEVEDSLWAKAVTSGPPAQRHPARWEKGKAVVPVIVTRVSENQPEIYGNAALGYDIAGFSARISVFYQDQYTRSFSDDGTNDVVVDSFTKIDLAFRQQIFSRYSIFLNINNLTNVQDKTSRIYKLWNWDLPREAELYGTTVDFGLRVSV